MKKLNKLKLKIASFISLLSIALLTLFSAKTYAYETVDIGGTRNFLSENSSYINDSLYPTIDNNNYYSWFKWDVDDEDIVGLYGSIYFYLSSLNLRIIDNLSSYRFFNIGFYFSSTEYYNTFDIYSSCSNWYRIDDLLEFTSGVPFIQILYSQKVSNYFYIICEYRRSTDGYITFTSNDFLYTNSFSLSILEYDNSSDSSQGYIAEINSLNSNITSLQSNIFNLNNIISQLQNTISNQKNTIDNQARQISDLQNPDFTFPNLIWTIASTPFESFKQIWNVDFLGLNIANFVIGLLSALIFIYILKKVL